VLPHYQALEEFKPLLKESLTLEDLEGQTSLLHYMNSNNNVLDLGRNPLAILKENASVDE